MSDLSSLSPLALLRVLRLNRNRIVSSPCSAPDGKTGAAGIGLIPRCFPQLEVLELGYNRISSIAALHLRGLTELRVLTLEGNDITRVDGLAGLPHLQQLVLAKNKIKRLEPGGRSFAGLPELRGLQLEENGLRTLAGFGTLPKLQALFLGYNRLSELNELDHIGGGASGGGGGCPALLEISLRNNPLARKHLYRNAVIRKLAPSLSSIDGREVTAEERERTEALYAAGVPGGSIGPGGEPLVSASPSGMPGAVYFYADAPRVPQLALGMGMGATTGPGPSAPSPSAAGGAGAGGEKVPLQTKSFSMGFVDFSPLGHGTHHGHGHHAQMQQAQQQQQQQQQGLFGVGGIGIGGLGIGGVSIGHRDRDHGHSHGGHHGHGRGDHSYGGGQGQGGAGLAHQMANLSLNLHSNLSATSALSNPRGSFSGASGMAGGGGIGNAQGGGGVSGLGLSSSPPQQYQQLGAFGSAKPMMGAVMGASSGGNIKPVRGSSSKPRKM